MPTPIPEPDMGTLSLGAVLLIVCSLVPFLALEAVYFLRQKRHGRNSGAER